MYGIVIYLEGWPGYPILNNKYSIFFPGLLGRPQYNNPFSFDGRTSFDAQQDLSKTRSSNFHIRPPPKDDDIWKKPPPDFRPQNFAPKPPKRNSREAMQPWKYGTLPGIRSGGKKEQKVFLPHILQLEPKEEEPADFVTRFHVLDSSEAKQEGVRSLQFPAGDYHNPKIHDFRPVSDLEFYLFISVFFKWHISFYQEFCKIINYFVSLLECYREPGKRLVPPSIRSASLTITMHIIYSAKVAILHLNRVWNH